MAKQLIPIAFLPWLDIHEKVSIGKVVFWPYDRMKASMLPSEYPVEQLDKYAHGYRTTNKKRANVACLSYPLALDRKLTRRQTLEVQVARYALFACSFLGGISDPDAPNVGWSIPSAEHFAIRPIPRLSGVMKNTYYMEYPRLHIVGSVGNRAVDQPEHLHDCGHRFFEPFRKAIDLAIRKRHCPSRPYMWRSLEWFFHAQTSQEHFTEEARLVVLCMAIEAAICEAKNRKDFIGKIAKVVSPLRLPRRYAYEPEGSRIQANVLEKWASDYYQLRNRLVHSKAPEDMSVVWRVGKRRFMHHYIASYVWFECLWWTIQEAGILPSPPNDGGAHDKQSIRRYARWHSAWRWDIDHLRERWAQLLTGNRADGEDY